MSAQKVRTEPPRSRGERRELTCRIDVQLRIGQRTFAFKVGRQYPSSEIGMGSVHLRNVGQNSYGRAFSARMEGRAYGVR